MQTHLHLPGRMLVIDLDAGQIHVPFTHQGLHFRPGGVLTNATEKQRCDAKTLQMPSDIERRPTQHPGTIGKIVKEDFPKDQRAFLHDNRHDGNGCFRFL